MLRAALIGFGSTGKTTLFELMTSAKDSGRTAHGRTDASIGISKVPDERLDRLTAMYNPKKRVPATVEFTDMAAPGRTAVRRLRQQGQKVGYISLRWFRPFPTIELRESLSRFKAVGVIDRDFAHGSADDGGAMLHEIRSCLYPARQRPAIVNFITGLGGRDVAIGDCQKMFEITQQAATQPEKLDGFVTWIGVRE